MSDVRTLNEKFMLRMPDGMRGKIKRMAASNNRSMNSEIVQAIEAHIRMHEISDVLLDSVERMRVDEQDESSTVDGRSDRHATKSDVDRLLLAIERLSERVNP